MRINKSWEDQTSRGVVYLAPLPGDIFFHLDDLSIPYKDIRRHRLLGHNNSTVVNQMLHLFRFTSKTIGQGRGFPALVVLFSLQEIFVFPDNRKNQSPNSLR